MTDLPFGEPLTPPSGAGAKARCTHPRQFREVVTGTVGDFVINVQRCMRCGKALDPAKQRAGRRNRRRGGAAELAVARGAGGAKVGPLGHPWDVVIDGLFRIQVRKYATPQGLRKIASELARIASTPGREAPAYVWVEPGRGGEQLITMRLRDFTAWTGVTLETDA